MVHDDVVVGLGIVVVVGWVIGSSLPVLLDSCDESFELLFTLSSLLSSSTLSTAMNDQNKAQEYGYPIFVVGLPRTGSIAIHEYFQQCYYDYHHTHNNDKNI